MTLIIDDQSEPGSYADKFKDAEEWKRADAWEAQLEQWRSVFHKQRPARCYRDRKAHDKLIATTNAIRAKHGMEPL